MLRPSILLLSLACLAATAGCGDDPATPADAAVDTTPADVAADAPAADVATDTTAPDAAPADAAPADAAPADAAPVDAAPVDAAPVDAAPVDAAPVDAAPADAAPADVAPADAAVDAASAFEPHAPCNAATAYMTGTAVTFGGAVGNTYSPACLRVRAGASVTFTGSFGGHPLAPGMGGTAGSPIPMQNSGSSAAVTFPTAGFYPYYCTFHGSATGTGMAGVVWVER